MPGAGNFAFLEQPQLFFSFDVTVDEVLTERTASFSIIGHQNA
jgi:hypothetical protein